MNVVLLMSGGVGNRFGANIPKQYVNLNGKPVIEYVLEACIASKKTDKIVVVMDNQYKNISALLNDEKICITNNGSDRYGSLKNGLNYIKNNLNCENIIIADAVAPLIYPELIDDYFNKLDDYDIVLTGQKITGALCDFKGSKYDREDFFMAQAPEGFKFKMLYENVDYTTKYQAISCLMPKGSKTYVNFNFKNNLKLTYNFELKYAEFLLNYLAKNSEQSFENITSSTFFETKGIKDYLLRIREKETRKWLDEVYIYYNELVNKFGKFKTVSLNQSSGNGIVMLFTPIDNREFVLKIVPKFLNRYENEKKAYKLFSKNYMCELLDFDDQNNALFLKKLEPIDGKLFDHNIKLTEFFDKVFSNVKDYEEDKDKAFEKIIDILKEYNSKVEQLPYLKEKVEQIIKKSISFYNEKFINEGLKIIHGDLRSANIMLDGNEFKAIDPIGYVGPIEMEPARFIIDDICDNIGFDPISRLKILLDYFSKWCDKEKVLYGLYIFFSMIIYNSVYENQKSDLTKYYLSVIDRIEKELIKK